MARIDPKIMLRLPQELKDKVQAAAKASNRSMNAEIAARLERTFHEFSQMDDDQLSMMKAAYQGMLSGVADMLIAQGVDAAKEEIEFFFRTRNREFLERVANVPD